MLKRERYLERIRPFFGSDLIKVITGIRRCGKSVMLELIKQELAETGVSQGQLISMNFEDMGYSHLLTAKELHDEIVQRASTIQGKVYLFFDEIQEVKSWEKCLNSLRVKLDCDIYITGSNANLLSGELATYLAGRYVEFVIYPFSCEECFKIHQIIAPDTGINDVFKNYIMYGGLPKLAEFRYKDASCRQYLRDIYYSVQFKDVIQRNHLRDGDLLQRIMGYIMANAGTIFSATSLSKFLKSQHRTVAPETIINYVRCCCDAYLCHQVKREDLQGKQILAMNEKYYLTDHGIRETIFGTNTRDIHLVLEIIVYLEMIRRGYEVTFAKAGTKEIDFVGRKSGQQIYIQDCYLLSSPETVAREFGVYETIKDNYPKYVLSLDEFDFSRDGIQHVNIRDFLLSTEW